MQKHFQIFLAVLFIVILVVVGVTYWSKDKPMPAVQNQAPSLSQSVQPQSDPTAAWKSYRNEDYGFEIKYPQEWKENFKDPQHLDSIFTLISPTRREDIEKRILGARDVDISIRVLDIPSFEKLDERFAQQIQESGFDFIANKKRILINGYGAYLMTIGGNGASLHIYFEKNNRLYEIIFPLVATMQELSLITRQILSTFRFLN
jgi:hypothetical protein